jgi:hypothetical protein
LTKAQNDSVFCRRAISARGHHSFNQVRNRSFNDWLSAGDKFPTIFTTSFSLTVASCDLTPEGTFNPAARHSLTGKSVLDSTDEIGTRNKSASLRPMMMADGRCGWSNP